MPVLLRVENALWQLELRGSDPRSVPRVGGPAGTQIVVSGETPCEVWVFDQASGELSPGLVCAPMFFEDGEYQLTLRGLGSEQAPVLRHRDTRISKRLQVLVDDRLCVGPIAFRGHVGLSDFIVDCDGEETRLTVEVFPTKIDYATDFESLLQEISNTSRTLALAFMRSTYRHRSLAPVEDSTDLDWLVILTEEMRVLEGSLRQISRQPNRSLMVDSLFTPVHKASGRDHRARRAIMRGRGRGDWTTLPGGIPSRVEVPSARRVPTTDTPENRWLKRSLGALDVRLRRLHTRLAALRAANPNRPDLVRREFESIEAHLRSTAALLELPLFVGVGDDIPTGFASLTMMSAAGYREAYRCLLTLTLGLTEGDEDDVPASLSQVHEIYEIWCYLAVLRIVAGLTGALPERGDVRPVINRQGLSATLTEGTSSRVVLARGEVRLTLWNNLTFSGLTGDQRPDIVIEVDRHRYPRLFLVLDAKYRLDSSEKYKRRYGHPGPPQDAINALHRYRDAIVVEDAVRGRLRPTVRGVALFPLGAHDAYERSPLVTSLDVMGIGAIPFLPGNEEPLIDWLRLMLEMPVAQLSVPGPPFSGRPWGPLTESN